MKRTSKSPTVKTLFINTRDSPFNGVENISIIVHKRRLHHHMKRKRGNETTQQVMGVPISRSIKRKGSNKLLRHSSLPNFTNEFIKVKLKGSTSETKVNKAHNPYSSKYFVNVVSECRQEDFLNPFSNPIANIKWRVYRCQLSTQDNGCCCSCNSDAMFEVMKSLYDCYKKKNCDHCNCILCSHLPKEERRQGELRKSGTALSTVGVGTDKQKAEMAKKKEKTKKIEKEMAGKSPAEKEKMLKELAMTGAPLPEGKTASEKELIKKVKTEVGLPLEPKTAADKEKMRKAEAAGLVVPLEGKSAAEKEKILENQAKAGIPLPEGRTASEKALIQKVKTAAGLPPKGVPSKGIPSKGVQSEKLRKAKAEGLLTPLEGKTPEQKEKILKGLAKSRIPLPEGKTASEKKLIEKVQADLGLPLEPKTAAGKKKYQQAIADGIVTPLEGKSAEQKEKILKRQTEAGIPLPEGRTPSEKALIAKVKATTKPPSEGAPSKKMGATPSERLRKAKAAGLITPLEGKSPEQKEKILRGLAMQGVPLPEGKTASEKALIQKVKAESGEKRKSKTRGVAAGAPALPPEKAKALDEKTAKVMKEGKGPSDECICDVLTPESEKAPAGKVAALKTPSERLKAAKAGGFLTPLTGKSPEQREKILKGLAKQGVPLPEGKTASEKKIIDKVRADLGMPPEPKTPSIKEKYAKAQAQGIITPLEGKSAAQKEKILKAQAEAGIPLPEGRTPSEKALINKMKTAVGAPSTTRAPSEKLRKAKAAGLLTPLTGKSPEQREKILKGLAKSGIPLPEGKTPSEKKIIDKVRTELGMSPEPKTPSMKQKYAKAQTQGIMTPLEGKTAAQKENILKAQAQAGIPLPEGRTPSEKALINNIRATVSPVPSKKIAAVPSEKLRKAKAAGLITPLEGKSPEQKEKILRGLAMQGIPLPEGKTASEKALIQKVKAESGEKRKSKTRGVAAGAPALPPEKAKALDEKTAKVMKEGKGPSDECICDVLTPESEKAPAGKVAALKTPSERLKAAKAGGFLTPLTGKSPEQREKILKGLAKQGVPLPEGKTASEKKIIDKVRADLGMPPEPKTPSIKEKYAKAQAQGIITPLEGKSAAQKEKILKAQAEAGIPLPEGRTPSEKALINKMKTAVGAPSITRAPSEKLRKAKAAGLLTPLEGKTKDQKEKIIKGLVKAHLPLPEGKTPSDKDLIRKVREDMGLPPEPKTPSVREKYQKALAAGVITPLEGKTPAQKEKVLKQMQEAGIPLPEGKTASEKSLVRRVRTAAPSKLPSEKLKAAKAAVAKGPPTPLSKEAQELDKKTSKNLKEGKGPSDECICSILTPESEKFSVKAGKPPTAKAAGKIPSEKLKKAKAAGLLTPLEGKTPAQKEKILRGLAMQGLPLPEGKTASEKKLVEKVRNDLGVSPEPKSASAKVKYDNAIADGLVLPLEGKSPAEKEKILKAIAERGVALPEGRTKSEKALIAKVKAELGKVPSERVPSEKLRKAKAAGLLTPLEGKSAAQKEKILKGLAETGLPLPEGKTPSEKAMVQKVKTEYGIPKAVTPSEKEIVRKAKAEGLLTPLAGKTSAQKEKKLKGLVEAGLPLPEGKTASEKQLIKKVRTAAGLPPEATPSEKLGKIRTKSKKVGAGASRRISKGIGGAGAAKAGIVEEFQDILKTTTCDRGCGCDKKKIRFKHSYVKIRVTSPDISSLCPCPNECVPGVKNGVLVDNEGIKVTVGSAVGFPKFSIENERKVSCNDDSSSATYSLETNSITINEVNSISEKYFKRDKTFKIAYKNQNMNANYSSESLSTFESQHNIYKDNVHNYYVNELGTNSDRYDTSTSRYLIACSESFSSMNLSRTSFQDRSSLNSLLTVKTESSLSFSTKSNGSIRTISIISLHNSSIIPSSSHYLCYECSRSATSISAEDSEHFTNVINYSALDSLACDSKEVEVIPDYIPPQKKNANNDALIYRVSHPNLSYNSRERSSSIKKLRTPRNNKKHDPIIVINDLNSDQDILKIVSEVLAKNDITNSSSIFVVVPTSDEYDTDLTESVSSTLCIRVSENFFDWKNINADVSSNYQNTSTQKQQLSKKSTVSQGLKITSRGKQFFLECTLSKSKPHNKLNQKHSTQTAFEISTQSKDCQVDNTTEILDNRAERSRVVSMDTTQDRPCCCEPIQLDSPNKFGSNEQFVARAFSEIMAPIILKQGAAQGLSEDAYLNVPRLNLSNFKNNFSLNQTTSVSICDIPPCCSLGFPGCHESDRPAQHSKGTQNDQYPGFSGIKKISPNYPCKCAPQMAGASAQPVMKSVRSIGCGTPTCKNHSDQISIISKDQGIDDFCSKCGRPIPTVGTTNGKGKKVKLPTICPCEEIQSTAIGPNGQQTRAVSCQCLKKTCACSDDSKRKKKKKNVVCECPQVVEEEPQPELEINESYIRFLQDEANLHAKENRKMKSDQTQTTSGFRINFKKRPPLAEEMSFEDALKYFEEHPEEDGSTQMGDSCFCDENGVPLGVSPDVSARVDNPDVDCECPYDASQAVSGAGASSEGLPGLKLRIGGKGSGSKGLSGICCFDMIQESNTFLLLHD